MKKAENFTPEMVASMKAEYTANPTKETVAKLAADFGRSDRSIIAKLVNLGIYRKAEKPEAGKSGATKEELVAAVEKELGVEAGSLESLTNATKAALVMVLGALAFESESADE